ncbi:hypothetical protein [Streptomyces sp. NBC_01439]|uniref:hypothetical protein n=1 Tax=Streptomyces sp. NBC_01439 TaxID=2903867 RepID=UPI002E2DEC1A|nr:hypothetical protein [Streptomyces sp. NBC_01439]
MSEKETYYLFAGLAPAGDTVAESFREGDVEGLWRRLVADLTAFYGEPHEVTRSSFQLFSHFRSDEFFAQLIVDWSTADWPRNMVPASIRLAHAEDAEAFAHSLYDHLDRLGGYCLALEENDSEYVRCNFTSPSAF